MAGITTQVFGHLPDGSEVTAYTLTSASGIVLTAINYGCTITSLLLPDREGSAGQVVLGFDSMDGYLASPHYIGAVIGRCAGRIANGHLSIPNNQSPAGNDPLWLSRNAGPHHLHGGMHGFDKVIWKAEPFENEKGVGIDFRYYSLDGEEGYPGNVYITVRYYLTDNDAFIINYIAETDKATVINMTQHTYWNLSAMQDSVLNHGLQINADFFLSINDEKLPTGALYAVDDTPFDFRQPKLVRDAFDPGFDQVRLGHGIDHCWALQHDYSTLGAAGMLYDPGSGRLLSIHTSEPGLQVYTGNALNGYGRNGEPLVPFSGICLETQHYPDAVNHPSFPSTIVQPGKMYQSTTVFQFSLLAP